MLFTFPVTQSTGVILLKLSLIFSLEISLLYHLVSLSFILTLPAWRFQTAGAPFELQLKPPSASRFWKTWAPRPPSAAWKTFRSQHARLRLGAPGQSSSGSRTAREVRPLPLRGGSSSHCTAFGDTGTQAQIPALPRSHSGGSHFLLLSSVSSSVKWG